jgi:hypothetical protein
MQKVVRSEEEKKVPKEPHAAPANFSQKRTKLQKMFPGVPIFKGRSPLRHSKAILLQELYEHNHKQCTLYCKKYIGLH